MKFRFTGRMTRFRAVKVLPFLTFSIILILLVQGCGKQDQSTGSGQTADILAQQEAIKTKIQREVQQNGWKVTVPVHQKMDFFYGDSLGNRVTLPNTSHRSVAPLGTKGLSIVSTCDGDPNGYANLNTFSLITDCSSGYKISFSTTISSDDNILAVSLYNSARTSHGSIRIYNSSNTLVYSNLAVPMDPGTNPPVDLGADPSNPGYELFNVTFTTTGYISDAILDPSPAAGYTMKFGAFYQSDCSDLESSNGGLWPQAVTTTQLPDLSTLNRVDPIWPNPGTDGIHQVTVYGMMAGVTCAMTTLTPPDLQEVEYSINGGTSWVGEVATTSMSYIGAFEIAPFATLVAGADAGTEFYGYIDPFGSLELGISGLSGGSVLLRYRDIVFNTEPGSGKSFPIPQPEPGTGNNCTPGPWSDPIVVSY
jgi:hypothetical protein